MCEALINRQGDETEPTLLDSRLADERARLRLQGGGWSVRERPDDTAHVFCKMSQQTSGHSPYVLGKLGGTIRVSGASQQCTKMFRAIAAMSHDDYPRYAATGDPGDNQSYDLVWAGTHTLDMTRFCACVISVTCGTVAEAYLQHVP